MTEPDEEPIIEDLRQAGPVFHLGSPRRSDALELRDLVVPRLLVLDLLEPSLSKCRGDARDDHITARSPSTGSTFNAAQHTALSVQSTHPIRFSFSQSRRDHGQAGPDLHEVDHENHRSRRWRSRTRSRSFQRPSPAGVCIFRPHRNRQGPLPEDEQRSRIRARSGRTRPERSFMKDLFP